MSSIALLLTSNTILHVGCHVKALEFIAKKLFNAIMNSTKVPGTPTRTYANEHVCIINYTRLALQGCATLAEMAENSLKL